METTLSRRNTMQTPRRTVGPLALLAALSLTATALAAGPSKGATFKGTASGQVKFATSFLAKDPLSFATSDTGRELSGFTYTDNVCDLAASKVVKLGTVKVVNGRFASSQRSAPEKDTLEDGGVVVTTTKLSGSFTSAKKAKGTLEYTQKKSGGSTGSCGPIKLTFTAVG
jgi:hypothetical protein